MRVASKLTSGDVFDNRPALVDQVRLRLGDCVVRTDQVGQVGAPLSQVPQSTEDSLVLAVGERVAKGPDSAGCFSQPLVCPTILTLESLKNVAPLYLQTFTFTIQLF